MSQPLVDFTAAGCDESAQDGSCNIPLTLSMAQKQDDDLQHIRRDRADSHQEGEVGPNFTIPFLMSSSGAATDDHPFHRSSVSENSLSFPSGLLATTKTAAAATVELQQRDTTTGGNMEIFDPTFKHLYTVPASKIVHLPPAKLNITRLVLCKNFTPGTGSSANGSCTVGELCKFVHVDARLDELPMHSVHVRYAWRHESLCIYGRHAPGSSIEVGPAPPVSCGDSSTSTSSMNPFSPSSTHIRSDLILITEGSQKAFAHLLQRQHRDAEGDHDDTDEMHELRSSAQQCMPHHCPSYFSLRLCKLGDQCHDIHVVTVDPTVTGDFKWVSVSKLSKISSTGSSSCISFSPQIHQGSVAGLGQRSSRLSSSAATSASSQSRQNSLANTPSHAPAGIPFFMQPQPQFQHQFLPSQHQQQQFVLYSQPNFQQVPVASPQHVSFQQLLIPQQLPGVFPAQQQMMQFHQHQQLGGYLQPTQQQQQQPVMFVHQQHHQYAMPTPQQQFQTQPQQVMYVPSPFPNYQHFQQQTQFGHTLPSGIAGGPSTLSFQQQQAPHPLVPSVQQQEQQAASIGFFVSPPAQGSWT